MTDQYKMVSKEDIELATENSCGGDCAIHFKELAERLLAERDAYREVAFQNMYGTDKAPKELDRIIDAGALRLLTTNPTNRREGK